MPSFQTTLKSVTLPLPPRPCDPDGRNCPSQGNKIELRMLQKYFTSGKIL